MPNRITTKWLIACTGVARTNIQPVVSADVDERGRHEIKTNDKISPVPHSRRDLIKGNDCLPLLVILGLTVGD